MNMICMCTSEPSLRMFFLSVCVCVCVCVCVPAGAACSSVCLYIPALSVRPALRHCAQLHLRPRNVLSSSSSSQRPSHSSPTPSAGQRAPPHGPGQTDLPGIWVDWTRPHSPGPAQGQEVRKEYITAKMLRPGARKSRGSVNPADLLFRFTMNWKKGVSTVQFRPGWEKKNPHFFSDNSMIRRLQWKQNESKKIQLSQGR